MGVGVKGVYFGRDDEIVFLLVKFFDGFVYDFFGFIFCVYFGIVKEVDIDVVGGFYVGEGVFFVDMIVVCQLVVEGDGRNLEIGVV